MQILGLFSTWLGIAVPVVLIVGAFVFFGGLITFISVSRNRSRAAAEPICTWEYTAAEWLDYATRYDLAKRPTGPATVKITPLDVWINDEGRDLRKELDYDRKCVTGCHLDNNLFKIRSRSWAMRGRGSSVTYEKLDICLPVPTGKEQDAAKAVEYFTNQIARQSKKVATVMPDDGSVGIFGDTRF